MARSSTEKKKPDGRANQNIPTAWKLANSQRPKGHGRQTNRGIEADLGEEHADSFHRDNSALTLAT